MTPIVIHNVTTPIEEDLINYRYFKVERCLRLRHTFTNVCSTGQHDEHRNFMAVVLVPC